MTANTKFILIIGDGEGFGNAILHRSFIRCPEAHIIGISRRETPDVCGFNHLSASKKSRYHHLSIDFMNPDAVEKIIEGVNTIILSKKGILCSIFLVTGTGFTDNEIASNPDLEKVLVTLNEDVPLKLSKQWLTNSECTVTHNTTVFYFSGLVAHPNVSDPSLQIHAKSKRKATVLLKELLNNRIVFVAPGAYRTEMLLKTIRRSDALLEWFSSPIADPLAKGGLPDLLAKYALSPRKKIPDIIIRPRSVRFLVTTFSKERLLKTLPQGIKIFGRSILEATGQSDAEYDKKIDYHRERNSYGLNFPYTSLYSKNLYPLFFSKLMSRLLDYLRIIR